MAGVWVFKNGVMRLEENPCDKVKKKKKVLVHTASNEVITSNAMLEGRLTSLGWECYYGGNPDMLEFHRHSSVDLISVPKDFNKFMATHMYDIVIKNSNYFRVREK